MVSICKSKSKDGSLPDPGRSDLTHLILLPPKTLQITPSRFIHSIRIPQIRRRFEVLSRRDRILSHAPTITEAIRQFEDGKYELAFRCAAFFVTSLQGFGFYACGVGGCGGEIGDCARGILGAAPTVSVY